MTSGSWIRWYLRINKMSFPHQYLVWEIMAYDIGRNHFEAKRKNSIKNRTGCIRYVVFTDCTGIYPEAAVCAEYGPIKRIPGDDGS